MTRVNQITLAVAAAIAANAAGIASAQAADSYFDNFTPLSSSAGPTATPETPITLSSSNFSQVSIADRATQFALGEGNSGNWDMIAMNVNGPDAGRYLFMPFESFDPNNPNGGVQRVDLWNNNATKTIVELGSKGFVAGDASRWTPWGGYLTAEESWSASGTASGYKGRLFEVTNSTADASSINFVQRNVLPRVSHEGLVFDKNKNLYFVDELNGGSIYKYVSANANATTGDQYFDKGQTFVLKLGAGGQFEGTNSTPFSGTASWAAITSVTGTPTIDTFSAMINTGEGVFALDGRAAADLVGGTGFNRPEDMEVKTLANGDEVIFFATTDSDNDGNQANGRSRVYTLNLNTNEVNLFADSSFTDLATGAAVGGVFKNADNLAIDGEGNIYIVEDRDGSVDDDIWFAKDINHDGDLLDEGEGLARWASNGTPGSEFTGLYFDPTNPNRAWVNIQHPGSRVDRTIQISAVPEPGTYALLLAGLGMLGFSARRRDSK